MSIGNNYDFESYCIVGNLVSKGGNVYALTPRYNYGFLFSIIQGLFYKLSTLFSWNPILTFRVMIVSLLTITDMGISFWIWRRYSIVKAFLFFLNPISIIITGYHNQFDNIAVLLMLLSVNYFNADERISCNDIKAILLMSLSLITKHIFFIFFLWILFNRSLKLKKKIMYALIPPAAFILGFVPFAWGNIAAYEGIRDNVFLYRSYNNIPIISPVLDLMWNSRIQILINIREIIYAKYFTLYIAILTVIGIFNRKNDYQTTVLIYLIAMVAFSSAIANQYLIIPLAALVVLDRGFFSSIYTILGTVYCILNGNELHLASKFIRHLNNFEYIITQLAKEGGILVTLMAWILAIFVIKYLWNLLREKEKMENAIELNRLS